MKNYLGIDWGEKRIGLALGDDEVKIASPFKTTENIIDIIKVIKEYEIDKIVLGIPLKMSNNKEDVDSRFSDFYNKLKEKTTIPIEKIDERLSSKGADSLFGNKKTKASRDEIAAMIILQNFLDKL